MEFFIGNVFSTKDYSVGQVKGCCYRWKSVGVNVEVGVDCGVGHVGNWYVYVVQSVYCCGEVVVWGGHVCCIVKCHFISAGDMAGVACRGLVCVCAVGKMVKDIGMTICKSIVVSLLPCLVAFLSFHPYMFVFL